MQFLRYGPSEWKGGDVLDQHNSIHYIQLTMEMEKDSHFPFLDTNIYRDWTAHITIRITISPLRLTLDHITILPTSNHPPYFSAQG
jgi:hypothetical protein